ncbi:MAG: DMT family transporter [Gammaproteobacteria bacterium]|nr:DMT family transporter [Gammaproteobacteria bacterium]
MTHSIIVIFIATLGGVAVAVQAQMMGQLDKSLGTIESVFITYGGGGLLIGFVMLAMRGGNLSSISAVPLYTLLAGVVGLLIVGSIGYSVPRLGLVVAFTLMVSSQFISGALMDHYGLLGAELRQLSMSRILGIAIILLGVWIVIKK